MDKPTSISSAGAGVPQPPAKRLEDQNSLGNMLAKLSPQQKMILRKELASTLRRSLFLGGAPTGKAEGAHSQPEPGREVKESPEGVAGRSRRNPISSHTEHLKYHGTTGNKPLFGEAFASGWDPDFDSEGSIEAVLNSLAFGLHGVLSVSQSQVTEYYNSLLYNEAQEQALNSAENQLSGDPRGAGGGTFTYPSWQGSTFTMETVTNLSLSAFLSQYCGVNLVTSGSASICLSDNMQQIQMQENTIQNTVQNNQTFLSSAVNQVQSTCSLLQQIVASIQQLNSQMASNIH